MRRKLGPELVMHICMFCLCIQVLDRMERGSHWQRKPICMPLFLSQRESSANHNQDEMIAIWSINLKTTRSMMQPRYHCHHHRAPFFVLGGNNGFSMREVVDPQMPS